MDRSLATYDNFDPALYETDNVSPELVPVITVLEKHNKGMQALHADNEKLLHSVDTLSQALPSNVALKPLTDMMLQIRDDLVKVSSNQRELKEEMRELKESWLQSSQRDHPSSLSQNLPPSSFILRARV